MIMEGPPHPLPVPGSPFKAKDAYAAKSSPLRGSRMSGIITLAVLAILCVFCIRWVTKRLRLPTPAGNAIIVVFVLVVLAMWGRHLR
jgi:hypothetical protein